MTASQEDDTEDAKPRRMPAKRLRQTMYSLALDWIHLRSDLPLPPKGTGRASNTKEYGHPAEWASDTASLIVELLTGWHDLMAEHRKETRPPTRITFGTDTFRVSVEALQAEDRRLVAAWRYLEPRCEELAELVDYEALKELPDLHGRINRTLGATAPKYTLPVPCPNMDCELRTLVRTQGVGQDFICCDSCGYTIKESHYPLLIRMTLDAFLSEPA